MQLDPRASAAGVRLIAHEVLVSTNAEALSLAGFFAKFYVFLAAVQAGLYPLAVIGVVASVVGAYYYVRIVKILYFDEPAPAFEHDMGPSLAGIITGSGVFTLFFLLGAAPLITAAGAAAASLFP